MVSGILRAKHMQDNNDTSSSSSRSRSDPIAESIDDNAITEILMSVFYELSSDKCYTHGIREQ